ncbi:MAG: YidC/Oxa1 family membrane protein insertase [Ardenticatenaceae bacterium]|nr:YidC/Oxa1 family membrane protein insertase [Ardenticatenaceae bacterium]
MWQTFIDFMLNIMVYLYQALGNNFLLALAAFTILTRVLLLPLNLRQQRSSIRMQEMQPQVQAIQKKYKDDQKRMMEEMQKIGYNPTEPLLGCLPLLVQMPIFFALFRVINIMLLSTPQSLLELKSRISAGFDLANLLPIDNEFLWLNLAQPDPYLILPVLVAGTMFLQQKFMMPAKKEEDKKQKAAKEDNPMAQTQQSMLYTMPIMFGFFAMSFNSGLAIYFVISNIIGIGQGYITRRSLAQARAESEARKKARKENAALGEGLEDGDSGGAQSNGSSKPAAKAKKQDKKSSGQKSSPVKSSRKKKRR